MKRLTIALSGVLALGSQGLAEPPAPASPPSTEQVVVMPNASTLLPPADRRWSAVDYEAASVVLAKIPSEKLPASWPEPSAVFLRMVNPDNLAELHDTEEAMSTRIIDARRYMIATAKITACYLPDIKQNQEHREDVAQLEGFFLQELGTLMSLVQEIETVPPPDFDKHAMIDPYVDKIRKDLDKIVGDVARSLVVEQKSRSPQARLRLARILGQEYPHLAPFLLPTTRSWIEGTLAQFPPSEPTSQAPAK